MPGQLINLTPHTVTLLLPSGRRLDVAPSGRVARLVYNTRTSLTLTIDGEAFPVWGTAGVLAVTNLPEPREGVLYIVSALVAHACLHRPDLVYPATGPSDEAERDELGRIYGVRAFRRTVVPGARTAAESLNTAHPLIKSHNSSDNKRID